jgi:hypothetical protein
MTQAAWPDEVRAVYVLCHPVKEKARWERLLPHLLKRGVPQDRIRLCAPTWGTDLTPETIFRVYDPFLKRGKLPSFSFKGGGLTLGEISLGLNFAAAVRDSVGSGPQDPQKPEYFITLESDVWLREDFVPRLRTTLAAAAAQQQQDLSGNKTEAPAWDYISLGEGVGTRPAERANASYYAPAAVFKPPHQWVFRCTDSMLFSRRFLERLSKTIVPFKEIIDWEMNFQLGFLHGGTPLWADPPLVEQGTCYNRMATSLPS